MTDELDPRGYGPSRSRRQPSGRQSTGTSGRYDGYDGDRFDQGGSPRRGERGWGDAEPTGGYDRGYGPDPYAPAGYEEHTGGHGRGGYGPDPYARTGYEERTGGYGRGYEEHTGGHGRGYEEHTGGHGRGGYGPDPYARGGYEEHPGGYGRGGHDEHAGGYAPGYGDPHAPTGTYPGYEERAGGFGRGGPEEMTGGFARVFEPDVTGGFPGWDGEEDDTGGRPRKGRPKGKGRGKKKSRRGRTIVALVVTLLLFAGMGGAAFYGLGRIRDFFTVADYDTGGTGSVMVEIKKGQLIADMAQTLAAKDVVKSAKAFVNAANDNPKSRTIEPGNYKLRQKMRATDALGMLLARDKDGKLVNKVVSGVTIPEGKTVKQTLVLLAKATGIPLADFQAAAKKGPIELGVPDWWFKRGDKKPVTKSLEGFLFPSTYEFEPNATAEDILKQMVNQFNTVAGELNFAERVQNERHVSPYEALIVASLAQAEAGNKDDLGKVARVAYNRVYGGTFPCNCLQFDVLINYWRELNGKAMVASKDQTDAERNAVTPYGYNVAGLPLTPIDNPSKEALQGAMDPPKGTWLYFVAIDKEGHSAFATTLEQHRANEQKACAAKIIC
jgi:UPF0755 protein